MTMDSDQQAKEWCQKAALGDRDAAGELLRHFHVLIFAYLRRLAVDEDSAEDLTQQTFCKVWQSISQFRGGSSVSTWMHRIAYCTYVDWVRQVRPATEQTEIWWQQISAPGPDPSQHLADAEIARQLYAFVDALPDAERQPIHLHYYQGLSLADTAKVLDVPLSTLKYRVRATLDQLRQQLARLSITVESLPE